MIANITKSTAAAAPNFRVGDERLIKLTPNAAKKVSSLLTKQGRPGGVLRVAVVGGGCSGLQYKMDLQDQPANRDFIRGCGRSVFLDVPWEELLRRLPGKQGDRPLFGSPEQALELWRARRPHYCQADYRVEPRPDEDAEAVAHRIALLLGGAR